MASGYCPKCGVARTGERFCEKCGNDFWRSAQQVPGVRPEAGHPPPPAEARAGNRVPVGRIIIWILILAAAAVAVSFVLSGLRATGGQLPGGSDDAIHFGTGLNESTLRVTGERSTFALDDSMAYSFTISGGAGTRQLDLSIAKKGPGGSETPITNVPVTISNPEFNVFGNTLDLGASGLDSGTYVMRVFKGDDLLAEGEFTLR